MDSYRNSGLITLIDPVSHHALGTYEFVTGGARRGSAPRALYVVGDFQPSGLLGERWPITQLGREPNTGNVWDARINRLRTEIEIHWTFNKWDFTYGCVGIKGTHAVYRRFVREMRYLQSLGPVIMWIS